MRYLFAIPAAVALLFCTLMLSGPHRREQTWVLAPQQEAASMKFAVEHETLRLLGATGPVRVTLEAPDGKLFQASQSKQYTFRTEPSQRHAWRFDWLDATTRRTAGYSTLRMTTQTTTQAGLRSNEQPVRQGKHNTHVHSYYWFDAHDTQTRMRVNVGEYRNPGDAYFRITGRAGECSDAPQLYLGRHVPTECGEVLVRGRQRPPLPSKHWRAVRPTLTLDVASPLGTITG